MKKCSKVLLFNLVIFFSFNQLLFCQQSGTIEIFHVSEKLSIEGEITEHIIRDTSNTFVTHLKIANDSILSDFLAASSILNCYLSSVKVKRKPRVIVDYRFLSKVNPKWDATSSLTLYSGGIIELDGRYYRNLELQYFIDNLVKN